MRISDWSSDVCSSALAGAGALGHGQSRRAAAGDPADEAEGAFHRGPGQEGPLQRSRSGGGLAHVLCREAASRKGEAQPAMDGEDRKSVVLGKSVSVRVDLGGRRYIKKNTHNFI